MQPQLATLLFLIALCCQQVSSGNSPESHFAPALIRMCLKPQFLQEPAEVPAGNDVLCASACTDRGIRCQGFWLPGGRCQLFVFDQCSHATNAANCSQLVWAFVRKQANLPFGQLCPAGYGNGYYGSTYKLIGVSTWTEALTKCSSEAGLTKFADGMDQGEVTYMHWMKTNLFSGSSYYIGGYSLTASSVGTWIWQACNATFLPEVWGTSQPNGGAGFIRADIWTTHTYGVDDETGTASTITKALCECVNPFV